jgi:hypothetical protein
LSFSRTHTHTHTHTHTPSFEFQTHCRSVVFFSCFAPLATSHFSANRIKSRHQFLQIPVVFWVAAHTSRSVPTSSLDTTGGRSPYAHRSPSSSMRIPQGGRTHPGGLVPSAVRPMQPRPVPRFHPSQLRPSGLAAGGGGSRGGGLPRLRGGSPVSDANGRLPMLNGGPGVSSPRRSPSLSSGGTPGTRFPLPASSADTNSQSFLALINSSKFASVTFHV